MTVPRSKPKHPAAKTTPQQERVRSKVDRFTQTKMKRRSKRK